MKEKRPIMPSAANSETIPPANEEDEGNGVLSYLKHEQELEEMVRKSIQTPKQLEVAEKLLQEFGESLDLRVSLSTIRNTQNEIKRLREEKNYLKDYGKKINDLENYLKEEQQKVINTLLGKKNFEQAEKIADEMKDGSDKQKLYQQIAMEQIANKDLSGAEATLEKIDDYYKVPVLIELAKVAHESSGQGGKKKFKEARKVARNLKHPASAAEALTKIAKAEAATLHNIKQAKVNFEEAKNIIINMGTKQIAQIEDEALEWKIKKLVEIAMAEKEAGCEECAETIKQCEELLRNIKDEEIKTKALEKINKAKS